MNSTQCGRSADGGGVGDGDGRCGYGDSNGGARLSVIGSDVGEFRRRSLVAAVDDCGGGSGGCACLSVCDSLLNGAGALLQEALATSSLMSVSLNPARMIEPRL